MFAEVFPPHSVGADAERSCSRRRSVTDAACPLRVLIGPFLNPFFSFSARKKRTVSIFQEKKEGRAKPEAPPYPQTVTQRSGHRFEARSSGASSHFVPLHHDPATRSRCRSEETPRPAKRPRRKAGARAKRGVSELCHVNTMDQLPNLEYKPAIQRSDCGFERRKTFAVEMDAP